MKGEEQPFEIQPYIGIGPFMLNTNIDSYSDFELVFYNSDDTTGWDTYELDNSFSIYTENGIVVSIACRALCVLCGVFVVGGHYSDFLKTFHITEITHDQIYMPEDDDYQDVYDINDLGIQLWCRYDTIVTVFCALE